MQHIDENTFIDDTLITCAEYNLFIDEMRDQEKYYQPDHWTSYQFPRGQALKPILGMRYSDAITFCEWLTKRDTGDWHYRLPTDLEAKEYPLKSDHNQLMLGYWIIGNDSHSRFAWISTIPKDPHGIARAFAYARDLDHYLARDLNRDRHIDDLDLSRDLNIARALDLGLDLDRDLAPYRYIPHDRYLAHALVVCTISNFSKSQI